jgi:hypothetical protein
VPADFKFDPSKATGLIVGSVSYEGGLGKYSLVIQPSSPQSSIELGFGCPIWPCLEPADDPAFSEAELPKQRGGGYAIEVPEGVYRIIGWQIVRGARRAGSTHSITHNFIYPPQVYDLMTDSSDELGCG